MVDRSGKRLIAGGIALSVAAAFTAHATITQHEAQPPVATATPIDAVSMLDAPAPGTTGTMPLPDLPVPADAALVAPTGIVAAQPFHLRGSTLDQSRALQCLTTAIYYEAASEPENGQRAVAQVVLNRVRHPAFPSTVCGVVFQGSDKAGCQFSFACDGAMARAPVRQWWERARRVAADALNGQVYSPVGLATHYHTYAVKPAWNRALVMTDVEGAHFFHRWKGWWGTPAAFTDRYVGAEPTPGPLRALVVADATATPAAPSTTAVAAAPVDVPAAPLIAPLQQAQPAYADSGTAIAARTDDSQILDKWKDSGQPLR